MLVHIPILSPLPTVINPRFYTRSASAPKILFPRYS
jgi:hypothetical protein